MVTFSRLGHYGRLGNQLFQIAAVISLALRNRDEFAFPKWEAESFFNLHGCFDKTLHFTSTYVQQNHFYEPIPYAKDMDLVGGFQSTRHFLDYEHIIKDCFRIPSKTSMLKDACAIHVRRGDYTTKPNIYIQLGDSYYRRAISVVNAKHYIVFSDDINSCRDMFKDLPSVEFSEGRNELEDFGVMSACEHQIIANSTYSWWAAYLNDNPDRVVVGPNHMHVQSLRLDRPDIDRAEYEEYGEFAMKGYVAIKV